VLPLLPIVLAAFMAQQPETMSLLKEPLYPPPVPRDVRAQLEDELAEARGDLGRDPTSVDAVLRIAHAQRGLGHIGDALETLTRALEGKADQPAIHLERGRGFIVIRKFELAERELKKVVETMPEAHCDIALSAYLLGDYKQAHDEYGHCSDPGIFGYLAARRSGADAGPRPPIPDDSRQKRAPTLPGSLTTKTPGPESSIYGVYMNAVDRVMAGDKAGARELLKPVVEKQMDRWMEAIYIAAEADYARVAPPKHKNKKKK